MQEYAIIETDAGLTVAQLEPGMGAEEVALKQGGVVVDPGPYKTFEDAYDSLLELQREEEDEEGVE